MLSPVTQQSLIATSTKEKNWNLPKESKCASDNDGLEGGSWFKPQPEGCKLFLRKDFLATKELSSPRGGQGGFCCISHLEVFKGASPDWLQPEVPICDLLSFL